MNNPKVKKILNRGGLGMVIVGLVAYIIGGGEVSAVVGTIEIVGPAVGAVLIVIRELMG